MANLFIIILNYNGYKDTIPCIHSLLSFYEKDEDCNILVVDNASTDQSSQFIQDEFGDKIIFLQSDKNGGYAYGNNIGIRYAIEHGADYICLLNNDTEAVCDAIRPCAEYLANHPETAFVGPAVVDYYSHEIQNTGGSISIKTGKTKEINKEKTLEEVDKPFIECDMIFGMCTVFRKELVREIGYISEKFFLFYEETDWCYRALRKGYKCKSLTTVSVLHKGSESVAKVNSLKEYLMERNRVVFIKRNATSLGLLEFLIYDFFKTVYRSVRFKAPFIKLTRYHLDGLLDRIDQRFPFIYFGEE